MRRVGLTMRVVRAEGYAEQRDALAWDWARFLGEAIPDCIWMPLPNVGGGVVDHVRSWGLDALILTGGNDVGEVPLRDETEQALISLAIEESLPLLGVCRGLQLIQGHFGGVIRSCPREAHVGTRHAILCGHTSASPGQRVVNSYHAFGVRAEELAPELAVAAVSEDGWAEAFVHRSAPVAAVQWHPERTPVADPQDVSLLRGLLGLSPVVPGANPVGGEADITSGHTRTLPCAH